jgi:hypothetical protein
MENEYWIDADQIILMEKLDTPQMMKITSSE